jgi:hypothetical protein
VYEWVYGRMSTYRLLQVRKYSYPTLSIVLMSSLLLQLSRTEPVNIWARKYAFWRDMFHKGEMPLDAWNTIDSAYDVSSNLISSEQPLMDEKM